MDLVKYNIDTVFDCRRKIFNVLFSMQKFRSAFTITAKCTVQNRVGYILSKMISYGFYSKYGLNF